MAFCCWIVGFLRIFEFFSISDRKKELLCFLHIKPPRPLLQHLNAKEPAPAQNFSHSYAHESEFARLSSNFTNLISIRAKPDGQKFFRRGMCGKGNWQKNSRRSLCRKVRACNHYKRITWRNHETLTGSKAECHFRKVGFPT